MKYLPLLAFLTLSFHCSAQYYHRRDTVPGSYSRQVTITLSPVVIQNSKYYYEGRRIQFEEFVFPMIAVHDKIVDHRLKVVRTLSDVRKFLPYMSFAYTTYLIHNLPHSTGGFDTFIRNIIGVFVFYELYDLSIRIAKRSAINRYNDVVLQPSASVTPGGGVSLGLNARF